MMRWIVLALSLGVAIMSMIHGVIAMLLSSGGTAQSITGTPSGSGFTWLTGILLITSAVLALIGGILAFNRRRIAGLFLVVAALICLFAHRDTLIYGGLYLVGGVLSFFLRGDSGYEDYDDEENEEEDDDEDASLGDEANRRDAPEDFRQFSYGNRRKERASKIYKEDREEYDFGKEGAFMSNEQVRIRSSKVCPACGASVGVDHKFCFICGGPLHTSNSVAADSSVPLIDDLLVPSAVFVAKPEEAASFDDLETIYPTDGDESEDEENEEYEAERVEIPAPHKVFVKPVKDDQPIPKRSLIINPDSAYQEFSNYTRRRKRNSHSLLRRILGPLLLLLAVGGVAWFLLGLRKLPEEKLLVPVPERSMPSGEVSSSEPGIAVPNGGGMPVNTDDVLSALRIESPTRVAILGTNVNIRSDHSTAGTVVTRLNSDVRGELLDRWEGVAGNLTGPWYRISAGGKEGWIYAQYVQPLDSRETSLPPGYTASLLKSFGSGKSEMAGQLGQPTKRTATSSTWAGLTATFKNDDGLTKLQISSPKHVLSNGVAVGITDEDLYRKVGYPSDYGSSQLRYLEGSNHGMAIKMKDRKVQTITVGTI